MADLNIVLLFCVLYSGVVLSTLWMTVAQKTRVAMQQRPSENRKIS